ncbi:diguanylate cyclase (GGDEF)-like protein [Novosphingobium chloroacetimidivorans]|uniref:diguanylate cyclase n=1 Tax=Novosphingobium chloroacetimidivorans TaxID=1428314 RepID=A0A7W7KBQ1_9SPHN|nr:GGDEF domain-containing protein [Novosphingobium chloroacetimidivorans]MBB4859877.1 diguanylate cyclase (GGDEF)-like protein [Novosphingobium chloroacetimidivorans]
MHVDLLTLYCLAVGTLLLSAAMTLWECPARPKRSREMGVLAGGYCALALGCAIATARAALPGAWGAALSNVTMLGGYLLVLDGVAALDGRHHRPASIGLLVLSACTWAIGGAVWQAQVWNYLSALPIAVVSAATAWEMRRNRSMGTMRAHRVVIAVAGIHALFYLARCFALPVLAAAYGAQAVTVAGKLTMYEGVLYSVGLPMALLALIREEAHAQLLEASHTDYLTGLGNRRWFFEQGEALLFDQRGAAVLAFDLDHFKAINDRHGHATGDQVLSHFADVVRSVAGADALIARIGGEEFAAVLPGHDRQQASLVGEAVARRFAAVVVHDGHDEPVSATVSIGVAELGCDGLDLGSLLSAADQALYLAKARGRNRIEFAPSPISAAA